MASVFIKGARYWCRVKGRKDAGRWANYPTPYLTSEPDAKAKAQRYADEGQATIDKRLASGVPAALTVSEYAAPWLDKREKAGIASVADDRGRVNNHVLPAIGKLKLADVKGRHVRDLVRKLNQTKLAPRTVINVFGILRTMMRDALTDELVERNPCEPPPPDLPEKVDLDPEWRDLATFEAGEVVRLLTDPAIPPVRRVQYALKALAGLRHGEAAGLRWRSITPDDPLSRMAVTRSYEKARTKTKMARAVPVHPALMLMLDLWRTEHWERIYGRPPGPDDLIAPTLTGSPTSANDAVRYLKRDLTVLGLRLAAGDQRDRGGHDLRAWFISTALEHGADGVALQRVTHTRPKDVISGYTRLPWTALCAAVSKLRISLGDPLRLVTTHVTDEESARNRWRTPVVREEMNATPTGFEPENMTSRYRERPPTIENDMARAVGRGLSRAQAVTRLVTGGGDDE